MAVRGDMLEKIIPRLVPCLLAGEGVAKAAERATDSKQLLFTGLADSDDDLRGAACQALIPIADKV